MPESMLARRQSGSGAAGPGRDSSQVYASLTSVCALPALQPNTQNGELVEVDGGEYVVTTTMIQFKLRGGK
jgi:hypothetical protein